MNVAQRRQSVAAEANDSLPALPDFERHTLVIEVADGGFFSNLNRVVDNLRYALGAGGCEAVRVDWRLGTPLSEFAYGTPADGNLWERFFHPLEFPAAPALERRTQAYVDSGMTSVHAYRMYKRGSRWRSGYGRVYKEHVRVHAALAQRVEDIWQSHMAGRFCVGVHVRHPDHDHECPRPAPPVEGFVRHASRLLAHDNHGAVFLATDTAEAVERFELAFGDRLVLQPGVRRARLGEGQLHHAQPAPTVELGVEVLIDAMLLARCDVLLHVVSNIATAVGYMNPEMRMVYCEPMLVGAGAAVRARLSRSPTPSVTTELSRRHAGDAPGGVLQKFWKPRGSLSRPDPTGERPRN